MSNICAIAICRRTDQHPRLENNQFHWMPLSSIGIAGKLQLDDTTKHPIAYSLIDELARRVPSTVRTVSALAAAATKKTSLALP